MASLFKTVVFLFIVLPALLLLVLRFVPPPITPLMVLRNAEGGGIDYRWRPLSQISDQMTRAVIAAEDARFCSHWGFDLKETANAIEDWTTGARLRGASTISMQTAKNVFLWPERNFLRKGLEAWLTPQVEIVWPKKRILEVYLNIAEMGPGIYGVEAAAQHYFKKGADRLTPMEAALITASLPNPRKWSPARPTEYLSNRAAEILTRAADIDPYISCLRE
ncbi:MAG: monofunctional biosynthetic peptidoglycan transglycosylase [Kiloniellales bacterium]|nr:monofunctional biosynthetic peptidoglycan transglycosylase [Kiloniellales bacterium]